MEAQLEGQISFWELENSITAIPSTPIIAIMSETIWSYGEYMGLALEEKRNVRKHNIWRKPEDNMITSEVDFFDVKVNCSYCLWKALFQKPRNITDEDCLDSYAFTIFNTHSI